MQRIQEFEKLKKISVEPLRSEYCHDQDYYDDMFTNRFKISNTNCCLFFRYSKKYLQGGDLKISSYFKAS